MWEGLRASQHESYWGLTAQFPKQPPVTFPAQFFSKLLCALKIRAGKGTAHPNVPSTGLLVLCCGRGELLLIHFRALEDLHYWYEGLFCWELLHYFKICFKWRNTSLTGVNGCLSSHLHVWQCQSLLSYCCSDGGIWGHVLLSVPFVIPQRKHLQH